MEYKEDPIIKQMNRDIPYNSQFLFLFYFGLFCGFITGFIVGCVTIYYWT